MFLERQLQNAPLFLPTISESQLPVALINGTAEVELTYVFVPAPESTLADYEFKPQVDNTNIFDREDVSFFSVEDNSREFRSYNVTVSIDLYKWTGTSLFQISAVNITSAQTVATSQSINLIAVGITFYTNENGTATLFGGENRPYLKDYEEIVIDGDSSFEVFIQYYDGSSSNSSLSVPLSGIDISLSGSPDIVTYGSSCSPVAGTYNGSDVELPPSCGIGFSVNDLDGVYVGPKFGLDFNQYRNGTVISTFEWSEIVQGSDLEDEGYSTFLNITVQGEVPPVVLSISPPGPFGTNGTEKVAVTISNVPLFANGENTWKYALFINFTDISREALIEDGSLVVNSNSTVSLTFELPAGVGTDLPWVFVATKPSGEELIGIDETNPPYLFSFVVVVIIDSITPVTGPEAGGTEITLVGEFPNIDSETLDIFFDGVRIDSTLISSTSFSNITFVTPPKAPGAPFEQTVTVEVGGTVSNGVTFSYDPTVKLESMTPSQGPVEGGTLVTLEGQFINFDASAQNSGVFFGSTKITTSLIQAFNSTSITFVTPPRDTVGDSSLYQFDVTVQLDGVRSNALQFNYDSPVTIEAISPSSGPEEGGTVVTLTGLFNNFDFSSSSIVIGATSVDDSDVTLVNSSTLQFVTPPLSEVGLSFSQPVVVIVESLTSNTVYYTYEELEASVSISSSGGSFDTSTGRYRLGLCSDGFFRAIVSSGLRVTNITYSWRLYAPNGLSDVLLSDSSITTDTDVLIVPFSAFASQNEPYSLEVKVETESASATSTLNLVQLSAQAISVNLINPRSRSPSDPNVSLTVPALIGLPGCPDPQLEINSTAMTFLWNYRGRVYQFSYLNTTAPTDVISPTLLGREFHIPQSLMEYGSFPLALTAYLTDQPEIRASDSTAVVIEPAALLPQINGGEATQMVSAAQDIVMSATGSRDPDVLVGDERTGLSYIWSCSYSWSSIMEEGQQCDDSLMPQEGLTDAGFTILSTAFAAIQNSSGPMFIEYSLQISKTSQNATGAAIERMSDTVTSTLILPEDATQEFETLAEISVINNQSATVDRMHVKYYEDVVITPVSESNETTWSFELVSPLSQSQTLLFTDENLLTFPGYYTVGAEPGRYSLGIKANVLSPNTEYVFLIKTFRTGFAVNEQTIILKTVEQPVITFGRIARSAGTTDDAFTLSAYANYDGDFEFFFLLTDEFGFETCVGGCQGVEFVSFRLGTAGNYSLRCDVYDSLGFTLLGSATGGNIVVRTSENGSGSTDLSLFSEEAEDAFTAGDHAEYQQLGTDMVKLVLSSGGSRAPETDSLVLANLTQGLNQIAANSVPNAIQSAGYVRTAAALASLTPDLGIEYDSETLYLLVNITINAVQRTPYTAALQQLQDLLDFYDVTPELILQSYSAGTNRRRLGRAIEVSEEEVIGIWLDLYEVMKEQIALAVLKKCPCGCVEEVRTGTVSQARGGLTSRLLSVRQDNNTTVAGSYVNPTQGELSEVRMKLGHFCNSEQGTQLGMEVGPEQRLEFSWCKGVFENSIKRLYFAVVRTPDYVYLSRLRQNVTLTDGLVGTMVGEIRNNTMQDATAAIDGCYSVQMAIPREVAQVEEDTPSDQRPLGLLLQPKKRWTEELTRGLYSPVFADIQTEVVDGKEDASFWDVVVSLSTTGVLTVGTRIAWGGALFSLEGMVATVMLVVGVVLAIVVLVTVAVGASWMIAARLAAASAAAVPIDADATFVERDVYGRGTAYLVEDSWPVAGAGLGEAGAGAGEAGKGAGGSGGT
ncbi:Plexin-D1 [Gracilariopsis chorda]|uniref:Plexin-D1 n=1 Tax=Gracilariopsis chorda TaxID=448386 RepID=A0A2V3IFP6_9FLOR|nr:Plexin-D1 [Gracilariopsis chorda]|eukprot:PXF40881.1 Plexin-D1 [Gracilariopsis chorda]